MEQKPNKRKKRWIVLVVILALLLALAAGGFALVKHYLGQIGRTYEDPIDTVAPEDEFFDVDVEVTPTPDPAPETSADPDPDPTPEPSEPEDIDDVIDPAAVQWSFIERIEDDHLINILLVGQDKYPGTESAKRQRSDSMILCSINPETGEVALISFQRDTYVQIPNGYSDNRLNVPYVLGGFPLLNETLTLNFGISVDGNFEVDMSGFKAIIEMLGGVDVELTQAEADYLRQKWPDAITVGANHLDADQALAYAQLRKIDSDFGRTNRQRTILMAIFRQVRDLPVGDLLDLMYNALPYLTTDLTDAEILSLAYRLLPLVSSLNVETWSVPSKGTYQYATIRGMSVLLADREKIRDLLEQEYLPLN